MNGLKGRIAFASGKAADYDIWTLELPDGRMAKLTEGNYSNDSPKWSPDGTKIAFVSNRTGTPELWLMNANGSDQRQLTKTGKWHDSPAWSPDGKTLVFCANYDGNQDIYMMDLGGPARRVTDYPEPDFSPSFSPDGSKIIFTSRRSGNDDIWVYDRASGNLTRLTDYQDRDYAPVYSPDGARIAWVRANFTPDVLSGAVEDLNIWLMDADGTRQRRLTLNTGTDRSCAWSPDGTKLVYTSSPKDSVAERLMVIDMASEHSEKLSYDRSPLEEDVGARPKGAGVFALLPPGILRKFYPEEFMGTERRPDWTR